jgi:hypothetical protein
MRMDVTQLLDTLRALGVSMIPNGNRLRVRPASKVPIHLWPLIERYKPEILQTLTPPTPIPWMLEEWRRQSIPQWRRIYRESVAKGGEMRAEYAVWMLTQVLESSIDEN